MTSASFKGTEGQQQLAAEIYQLMTTQGALFAMDAPIKQSLDNLAEFLSQQSKRDRSLVAQEIDAALSENGELFARQEVEGSVLYVTSRIGVYRPREAEVNHSFRQRLHDPENPLPIDDISVVVSTSRPAITTVEPVFISDYWQVQAGFSQVVLPGDIQAVAPSVAIEELKSEPTILAAAEPVVAEPAVVEPVVAEPVVAEPAIVEPVVAEPVVAEPVVAEPVVAEPVVAEPAVVEPVVAEPAIVPAEKPVAKPAEKPVAKPAEKPVAKPAEPVRRESTPRFTQISIGDGVTIDLSRPVAEIVAEQGASLRKLFTDKLEQDPLRRIVSFGRRQYPEVSVASLGKNDMRRIREYILEIGEPALDTQIIADLYYHNPRQGDFEGFRFSLNYRLSREKDFEFVGVEGASLWSVKGLPSIGTKRVKASEMAQITSYLTENFDDSLAEQSAEAILESKTVNRLLTFFEWEYGILPLNASLAALLPAPMLPDQRSAVLRFESPQHYTNYLVEVRYPTGNRGGWIQGLEEFFHEHLVAGALITIGRGEGANVFTLSYEEASETTERLLTLDEKKNKFAFANISYYCAVDSDRVLSQQRYGKLKNLKSLPMNERRKADAVLEHVVETVGDQLGRNSEPRYRINLDDLFVTFNVLRPASRPLLSSLLEHGKDFAPDTERVGSYIYTPEPTLADEEEEEAQEEPKTGGKGKPYGYDDDDE